MPSGVRTHRVDRILELTALEEEFAIPDGFGLTAYWTAYLADFRARLHTGEALVRLTPAGARPRPPRQHTRIPCPGPEPPTGPVHPCRRMPPIRRPTGG